MTRDGSAPSDADDTAPEIADAGDAVAPTPPQTKRRIRRDWTVIRHLYEETDLPVAQIMAIFEISTRPLYARIERENWRRRNAPFANVAGVVDGPTDGGASTGTEPVQDKNSGALANVAASQEAVGGVGSLHRGMIVRLYEAMDRQLGAIELQQRGGRPLSGSERERHARQMNVMTRSMEKLTDLHEQDAERTRKKSRNATGGEGNTKRDPETWRLEIARRITRIREAWLAEEAARDG